MAVSFSDLTVDKKGNKLDQESDNLIDAILSVPVLSKVRRADAFNEYRAYLADTEDTITFNEFLEQTQ